MTPEIQIILQTLVDLWIGCTLALGATSLTIIYKDYKG